MGSRLNGIDLRVTGGDDYNLSQRWSGAIHRYHLLVDGIFYASRHHYGLYCVALFERARDTWAARLGFDDRPAVLHHDEGRALLGATATALGWDTATFSLAELATAVDRCRLLADDGARCSDPAWPLAQAFEERMQRHGAIDFVAMLSMPLRLFREHPEALRTLQLAYQCVLADEAQDLDPTQWALLELLAAEHRNLVVVGDPVQTSLHSGAPMCVVCWTSGSAIQPAGR